jgi:hypothetical protein
MFGACALAAGAAMTLPEDRAGVVTNERVPADVVESLRKRGALGSAEEVLAYYDCTLTLDGTEAAFVTAERVVYVKNEKVTVAALSDVTHVTLTDVPLVGDVLQVQSTSGKMLKIEIAPLNDGVLFANALEGAWQQKKPGAAIRRPSR